jgi:hypothetical protein
MRPPPSRRGGTDHFAGDFARDDDDDDDVAIGRPSVSRGGRSRGRERGFRADAAARLRLDRLER